MEATILGHTRLAVFELPSQASVFHGAMTNAAGEIAKFALLVAAHPLPAPLKLGWPRDIIKFSLSAKNKQEQKLLCEPGRGQKGGGEVSLPSRTM